MFYSITSVSEDSVNSKLFDEHKKSGDTTCHWANRAPAGWTELTDSEFAKSSFGTYIPKYIETKYILFDSNGNRLEKSISAMMFYEYDNVGYAISKEYWDGKIRYFRFGCDHDYSGPVPEDVVKEFTPGRCLHIVYCKKCKIAYQVDSSD